MSYPKSCIYLDNAATSRFKPKKVINAVISELKQPANAGRGGHRESIRAGMIMEDTRDTIRKITFPGNVIFTKNCTEALNLAILGGNYRGKILTSVFEHNSVLRPLEKLKSSDVTVIRLAPASGIITPDLLLKRLTPDVSLVVLGEMSNVTGVVQPIDELGALLSSEKIPFIVDAAQSLGHTDSEYTGVTMLAAAGHKGLHGPEGTGFLVMREGVTLSPLLYGGTGTAGASLIQPSTPPEGLESGTQNVPAIAGLNEGIMWTYQRKAQINEHISTLSEQLTDGLRSIDGVKLYTRNNNGVISFNIRGMGSSEVADMLDERYCIAVRAGLHCAPLMHDFLGTKVSGAVRMSIGVNNTPKEIENAVRAVKELALLNQ